MFIIGLRRSERIRKGVYLIYVRIKRNGNNTSNADYLTANLRKPKLRGKNSFEKKSNENCRSNSIYQSKLGEPLSKNSNNDTIFYTCNSDNSRLWSISLPTIEILNCRCGLYVCRYGYLLVYLNRIVCETVIVKLFCDLVIDFVLAFRVPYSNN